MADDWKNYEDEADILHLLPDTETFELKRGGSMTVPLKADGRILTKNLTVEVPLRYCKRKEYNGAAETFACLGEPVKFGDIEIKQPTLGVLSMLEMTNNPFVIDFANTTTIQKFKFLYINQCRRDALPLCREWAAIPDDDYREYDSEDETTWTDLDKAALVYADILINSGVDLESAEFWLAIIDIVENAYNGFEMMPKSSGGGTKFLFGAEVIGSMIVNLNQTLRTNYLDLVWDTPLCLIGFTAAATATANGTKGVSRPYDHEDQRRQMILTYLREVHGQLHPWQIDDPLNRKLTHRQEKHESCKAEFARLQAAAKEKLYG